MIEVDEVFEIDYTDASGQSKFERCPALFMFERLMGLRDPASDTIAPDYGTCIHRALPFCYNKEQLEQAYTEFDNAWGEYDYGWVDNRRNPDMARTSLKGFMDRHLALHQYEILSFPGIAEDTADRVSPNEVPFLVDIGGPLPLAGRLDLVVRYRSTNTIWVVDYKTASEISDRYFKNFEAAYQPVLYTVAACHLTNEDVKGMIVEAVRTSTPTSKLRGESQMHFCFVTDYQMEMGLKYAKQNSEDMLRCNEAKQWPMRPSACSSYAQFGQPSRQCPFRKLCNIPNWRDLVREYNIVEPFHPFYILKDSKRGKKDQTTKEPIDSATGSTPA